MSETAAAYENRSLFSEYYLSERLADHPQWAEEVSEPFKVALELYQSKRDVLEGMNEGQTEAEFIRPLLREVLGFAFDVQTPASRQGKLNRPDYSLFLDEETKASAQAVRDDEGRYFARAVAVADAKFWGRPLDRRLDDPREELSNANPSFQIVNYLVATGVDWGVLTNGKVWRLYYAQARSRVDTYFEVDLAAALENEDQEAFRVFYQFFRAAAFDPDPDSDRSFLEAVYEGSASYGAELQDRLKGLIFDEIFLDLAQGFLGQRKQNGGVAQETPESLAEVYQGTLRLLYRLLFLLHAEARGLLPVEERQGYYQYSLTRLKREVAERVDQGGALSRVSTDIWNDLSGLFRVIDRGDPELNVPRYNGGLFRRDEPRNAFLQENRIADHYLAPALDRLARERDPESGQRRFIDYKSLDVEQLGSIYEGLLEFKLRVADEDLAVVKEKGREVYRAASEVDDPQEIIKAGQPYLENDKGERKATGSYYTPHYIVEYIVEQTLGPVLERRAERFRGLMAEIEPKRARLAEIEENLAQDAERQDATVSRWQNERTGLERELEPLEAEAREALLGLRVCDPAMGSGHFLVYAADWLAERLIALLNEYPDNPLLRQLARTREAIVAELERQGVAIEAERLKDTSLLKRAVMKRCIYGVDLNPMATELAKLSLWLDSFTVGAPLSFLDHHLKTGNSLIGTTVDEVREAMEATEEGQMHLFAGPFAGLLKATSLMRDVATRADATFADVEVSSEKYAAFEEAMAPYKRVLDLWVARHFGVEDGETFLRQHGLELLQAEHPPGVHDAQTYQQAARLAAEQRFFHWELEFPEVFVDLEEAEWKENPGFDALVGNPPYVDSEEMSRTLTELRDYCVATKSAASGNWDLYVVFVETGLELIKLDGHAAMIVPNKLLGSEYSQGIQALLSEFKITSVRDYSNVRVFEDAAVYPIVYVVAGSEFPAPPTIKVDVMVNGGQDDIPRAEKTNSVSRSLLSKLPEGYWWAIFSELTQVLETTLVNAIPLENLAQVVGAATVSEAYELAEYVEEIPGARDDGRYLEVVNTGTIDRYLNLWGTRQMQYLGSSFLCPAVARSTLQERWPSRYQQAESPKLIIAGMSRHIEAIMDPEGQVLGGKSTVLVMVPEKNLRPLLAILNGKLATILVKEIYGSLALQGGYLSIGPPQVRKIPVPHFDIGRTGSATDLGKLESLDHAILRHVDAEDQVSEKELLSMSESSRSDAFEIFSGLVNLMIYLSKERLTLQQAVDPSKYLNLKSAIESLSVEFAKELKYGTKPEAEDSLLNQHHDIDALRLVHIASNQWRLAVHVKLRDPAEGWESWQYEEDGRSIKRKWVPAYRFEIDEQKARYYRFAFEVLDEFEKFTSFPGGYSRTAQQKLMATKIPVYDPDVDLTPLVELRQELEEVDRKIKRTDALIDQIVYKLYGLTDEEIAIVEAGQASASR